MANLNKVFLIGNLTADPELRYAPSGSAVTDLRLAINRFWSGKDGERREETLFIDVTVWDRMAENCGKFLRKGRSVHVEGYLRMESWETPQGEKRSKIKVVAESVQFLGGPEGARAANGAGGESEEFGPPPMRESRKPAPAARDEGRSGSAFGGRPAGGYGNASSRPAPPPASRDESAEEDDIPF
jgi:single-strand DNA-binding protein